MITRETLREIAAFQSPVHDAVTFYFQPAVPQDKSHRQEAILVKDLVRNAILAAEKEGKNGDLRTTLNRIPIRASAWKSGKGKSSICVRFAELLEGIRFTFTPPSHAADCEPAISRHAYDRAE
jgi:hypothetical protein